MKRKLSESIEILTQQTKKSVKHDIKNLKQVETNNKKVNIKITVNDYYKINDDDEMLNFKYKKNKCIIL